MVGELVDRELGANENGHRAGGATYGGKRESIGSGNDSFRLGMDR